MSNDMIDLTVCLPGTVLTVTTNSGSEWYIGITSLIEEVQPPHRLVRGVMIQSNGEKFTPILDSPFNTVISRFIKKNVAPCYGIYGEVLSDAESVRMVMDARTRRMLL